jgi:hypothetical protein
MRQNKIAFGDWQTPLALADAVVSKLAGLGCRPAFIVEPTCGEGQFLVSAAKRFRQARLIGYERNPDYVAAARSRLSAGATLCTADFFQTDWAAELGRLDGHVLVLGNPPWVTASQLGAIGGANLPGKTNFKGLTGYEALTGKSNFDVSEWMILRLLESLRGASATLAMLCKSAVARKVLEYDAGQRFGIAPGGLFRIDAREHFGAAVDAVLFVCRLAGPRTTRSWPVFSSLNAEQVDSHVGVDEGVLVADMDKYARTKHLSGVSDPVWRSGVKHDCAPVMELRRDNGALLNGLGERVSVEDEFVFPLLKSSDVANGRTMARRLVIVPQRVLGEDTTALRQVAPRLWSYLSSHRELLGARKSSIYRKQHPFSVFGVGPYSFSPYKVATSGLYKRHAFALVQPIGGRPVMLDDTCYFLPYDSKAQARLALQALQSQSAKDFISGRVFWDAKRPINKTILQALDLHRLQADMGMPASGPRPARQQPLTL